MADPKGNEGYTPHHHPYVMSSRHATWRLCHSQLEFDISYLLLGGGREEGKGGEGENGEGRGKGGSWGNSALVVEGIDAPVCNVLEVYRVRVYCVLVYSW